MSHVTRHTSHVTRYLQVSLAVAEHGVDVRLVGDGEHERPDQARHTSHVTRHTSHATRHTSRHLSQLYKRKCMRIAR